MNQNTSGALASAIILQARYKLNSATTDTFFPDAQMLAWLNEGQRFIALLSHCLQTTESISLVANTLEYSIVSTVYFDIETVHYVDASGVHHPMEEAVGFRTIESAGNKPDLWYEHGGKIGVYKPLSAVTTEAVKLYFAYLPTDVAAVGNAIVLPKIFDSELVEFIYIKGLQKDGHPQATALMEELKQRLILYRSEAAQSAPNTR